MKSLFLYLKLYNIDMKKIAVILLVTFITAVVVSSCSKSECPAYSKGHAKASVATAQTYKNV
jgi:hypothetical protein